VAGSPDPQISWIMIVEEDTTAPVLSIEGNKGEYSVDEQISISCSATDDLSGIATVDCPKIEGVAYEVQIGVNKFKATATDRAGHTAVQEIEFTVTVDFNSLAALTKSLVSNENIAESLSVKLQGAEGSAAIGNKEAMEGKLNAYMNQL
uniref:hypothetical protein n=1 Tax=Enterococcus faecium TaxID=1352 RepID=UPI0030C857B2